MRNEQTRNTEVDITEHGIAPPGVTRRRALQFAGAGAATIALAGAGVVVATRANANESIIPRGDWGFEGWAEQPDVIARSARTHYVVHYQGGFRPWPLQGDSSGYDIPRDLDRDAKKKGDKGIDYSFVIAQSGEIFEGRGWDYLAGAVENFNTPAISVQVHIRAGYKPSREALDSLEWLYGEANRVLSRSVGSGAITEPLRVTGHKDHHDTSCPGGYLDSWIDNRGQELYRDAQQRFRDRRDRDEPGDRRPPDTPESHPTFPGRDAFKIGQSHPAVVDLDKALIRKGYARHHDGNGYQPGPVFTEYTRKNVRDFQRAQGWSGSGADGYPGPQTWDRLMS